MDHTLLLARHGITAWNAEKRLQGSTDIPLSEEGVRQAAGLGAALAGERLTRALVSGLGRARETAAAVSAAVPGCPAFEVEPRLAEMSLGEWEGRLASTLAADPAFLAWQEDSLRHAPPGGETALDVARRVAPLLDVLARGPEGSRVLLVGHQVTLAVIECLVTGTPLDQWRSRAAAPCELRRLVLPFRA